MYPNDMPQVAGSGCIVTEVRSEQTGNMAIGSEKYTRKFRVEMESFTSLGAGKACKAVLDSLQLEMGLFGIAYNARLIPFYASNKQYVQLRDISASQDGEEPIFNVTATYGTPDAVNDQRTFEQRDWPGDPRLEPWSVSFGFQAYKKAADRDLITGMKITNSAGDPFTTPWEEEYFTLKVTIARPENDLITPEWTWQTIPTFSPTAAAGYMGRINSENVLWVAGIPCGKYVVLVRDIKASTKWWCGVRYFECAYEVELNPDGWLTWLLDHGYYTLDADGVTKHSVKVEGEKKDEPVLLDGNGRQLSDQANPVYLPFHTKLEAPLSGLYLNG